MVVEWLARQINEAFPWSSAPSYLVRDKDRAYGHVFTSRLKAMGIRDRPISPGCPWQNPYVSRLIGTMRRECLDRMLVVSEAHLRHILLRMPASFVGRAPAHPAPDDADGRGFAYNPGVLNRLCGRTVRTLLVVLSYRRSARVTEESQPQEAPIARDAA
jgi:Integrase core domain